MAVHVVGNLCLDTTFRLSRFPLAGETLNAQGCETRLGGKGANQAFAAWCAGADALLWAAIGRDREAEAIRDLFAETGLSARTLVEVEAPTDRSVILLDGRAENLIVSAVAAARGFAAERAGWTTEARPGDILVMQNNLGPATTAACLAQARGHCLFTILNASPLGEGDLPPLGDVDLVVVNRSEGETLTGEAEPERIVAALLAAGSGGAVVTLGPAGAVMRLDDEVTRVPALSVRAVDTSGAGDVLCGTLAGLLDRGLPGIRALRVAIRAASLAVTRRGAFGCGPSAAELNDILTDTA